MELYTAHKTRKSRCKTPWDNTNMTSTQRFIHDQHKIHYDQRHPSIEEVTGEAGLINSHVPSCCLWLIMWSLMSMRASSRHIEFHGLVVLHLKHFTWFPHVPSCLRAIPHLEQIGWRSVISYFPSQFLNKSISKKTPNRNQLYNSERKCCYSFL